MNSAASPALAPKAAPPRQCPRCGSPRVHRSRRKGGLDRVFTLLGGRMRRCHDCRARQAWFRSLAFPMDSGAGPATFLIQAVVIGGGLLFCLLFLWWMMQRLRETSG